MILTAVVTVIIAVKSMHRKRKLGAKVRQSKTDKQTNDLKIPNLNLEEEAQKEQPRNFEIQSMDTGNRLKKSSVSRFNRRDYHKLSLPERLKRTTNSFIRNIFDNKQKKFEAQDQNSLNLNTENRILSESNTAWSR